MDYFDRARAWSAHDSQDYFFPLRCAILGAVPRLSWRYSFQKIVLTVMGSVRVSALGVSCLNIVFAKFRFLLLWGLVMAREVRGWGSGYC